MKKWEIMKKKKKNISKFVTYRLLKKKGRMGVAGSRWEHSLVKQVIYFWFQAEIWCFSVLFVLIPPEKVFPNRPFTRWSCDICLLISRKGWLDFPLIYFLARLHIFGISSYISYVSDRYVIKQHISK